MGLSGFFGKRNLSKVEPEIELPAEIYANKPFPLKVSLKNKKRFFPGFLLRVSIEGREILFPFVDVRAGAVKYVTFSFNERGLKAVENIYICSVFPFYFFTRCRAIRKKLEAVVFPEPIRCDLASPSEDQARTRGEKTSDRIGYEADIVSIRDYIQGDPMKYINWKASAKTGEFKTKELSSAAGRPVIIDFDKIDIKNTEKKISCIAYILLQLLKKNIPVGLRINNRLYKPDSSGAHKISLMKELAMYATDR